MAAGKMKTKGKRKPRQRRLPGMETPKIKAIEDLALEYTELRDERMRLHGRETEKQDLLFAQMQSHQLKSYELEDGRFVKIVAEEKVKVTKAPKPESNGQVDVD